MIRINLAPPDTHRRPLSLPVIVPASSLGVLVSIIYAVAIVALGGYYVVLAREETRLTRDVQEASTELGTLKATLGNADKVREHLAELNKRVKAIEELTKNQALSIMVMDAFADMLPRDLWITTLEERGHEIRAAGAAFSAAAVADFMSNLRSSGKFQEVDIVVSKQDLAKTPSLVTFEVTCRFGT
jgi:Tfp pilus assembly protein PilN